MTATARSIANRLHGLYAIADDDPRWGRDPVDQARAALAGGASSIQLRAKHASDGRVLEWGAAIGVLARASAALFFVNDRFDLALALGADGVHLGQDDLPPARLPREVRARLAVGRSTHSLPQLRRAVHDEAVDYAAFGPVFATATQASTREPRGLDALAEAVRVAAPCPLVAIGGITPGNARAVAETGARAVAVISTLAGVSDPEGAARGLCALFDAAGRGTP